MDCILHSTYHSPIPLCPRITLISMSVGWNLNPRNTRASSNAPTINKASCGAKQMRSEVYDTTEASNTCYILLNI